MSRDPLRRASWVVAAAASAIGAVICLYSTKVGLATLGLAILALSCAAFLSFQVVIVQLAGLGSVGKARPGPRSQRLLREIAASRKDMAERTSALRGLLEAQPYLNAELVRRYEQLIPSDQPMPTLGANWAATAPTILFIIDQIMGESEVETILECGSGASTVWAAAAFRKRGHGHVFSLDHEAVFAEQTREHLRRHGLAEWATVIDAPLTDMDVPGRGQMPWYNLSGLPAEVPRSTCSSWMAHRGPPAERRATPRSPCSEAGCATVRWSSSMTPTAATSAQSSPRGC